MMPAKPMRTANTMRKRSIGKRSFGSSTRRQGMVLVYHRFLEPRRTFAARKRKSRPLPAGTARSWDSGEHPEQREN